tara:strand:- start:981 stop:2012 length:1032 start_codon:yes stop_codon:yes gene_type:complete
MNFDIDKINEKYKINNDNYILKYLKLKTKSVNKDSKARKSLGNIYALKVLIEDFLNNKKNGSSFTNLLDRIKRKPFGSKIQNHPLDNRLNDEFKRKFKLSDEMLPVQGLDVDKKKYRKISNELMNFKTKNPKKLAEFTDDVIENFIKNITEKQKDFLKKVERLESKENYKDILEYCLDHSSDARLFEIFAYVVLKLHYSRQSVIIIKDSKKTDYFLSLYKTGRTNANDGGIDYVLKPLGRFFQVTETLDFKKYFLDFDKLNKFPITFVVKHEDHPKNVFKIIQNNAQKILSKEKCKKYLVLFEEIITSQTLREYFKNIIDEKKEEDLKNDLILNYKLEYGYFD